MSNDRESFVERWARRKREAKRPGDEPVATPVEHIDGRLPVEDDALDAGEADTRPLPTLDDVTPEGNVAAFLEKRIPAELQRMALRKAWASDPVIGTFIEMAENQWDWNTPGGAPGWGDLDAGTDIEMLLAQATGRLPPPKPVGDAVAAVDNSDASMGTDCGITPHSGAGGDEDDGPTADAAAHNDLGSDTDHSSRPVGDEDGEALSLLSKSPLPDPQTSDIPEKTQRLAAQHRPPPARRSHGGALPKV
jgi:hypothetical protein